MHHIVLWKWKPTLVNSFRAGYTAEHVNIVAAMIRRAIPRDMLAYRIICVTDDPAGITGAQCYPLWDDLSDLTNASGHRLPSCYRRLKLYDPQVQDDLDISPGDRIVSLDLDVLVTGDLREVLQTPGDFVGWELRGAQHQRVLNGSFQMFTAGHLAFVWKSFIPSVSPNLAHAAGYMGSDQAWLSWHLASRLDDDVKGLKWPAIASYPLQTKIQGLFEANRLVFFHGQEKPWMPTPQAVTPWITKFWRLHQ